MKLQTYLLTEELTTSTVGNMDADSVTSNKKLRLKMKDRKITQLVDYLKKRKNTNVSIKGDVATIDLPYAAPKELMKQLSNYVV